MDPDRSALVTGGAGAIGSAIVAALRAAGHRTIVLDRGDGADVACDLADEALLWLAQALTPGMRERGFGRVVVVTSDTAWSPASGDMVAYVASKATLHGLVRVLARPLGEGGVTINAVAPGLTRTPAAEDGVPASAFEDVLTRQALRRPLVPEDVAGVVAFLASDAAAAVTGQALCADGGLVFR